MNFFSFLSLVLVFWPLECRGAFSAVDPVIKIINPNLATGISQEVIIYYGCETAPDTQGAVTYKTFLSWLYSSKHPKAIKVAQQLERDLKEFPKEVDKEINDIRFMTASLHGVFPLAVVIFTNRMIREGCFLVFRKGQRTPQKYYLSIQLNKSSSFSRNSPLADQQNFKLIMQMTAKIFNPQEAKFILITKSHGSKEIAITPRLAVSLDETNKKEFLQTVINNDNPDDLPKWAKNRKGISKKDFFTILNEMGIKNKMQFSLVVMGSCSSNIGIESLFDNAVSNIGVLISMKGVVPYKSFSYRKILELGSSNTFSQKTVEIFHQQMKKSESN